MGGKSTKEENTAHTHGNQLVTVIQTQDLHSQEHEQHQNLLIVIVALQSIIILMIVGWTVLKIMKKRWVKKGIHTARSLANIHEV